MISLNKTTTTSFIPEEDRAFFLVLDIVFGQHHHSNAELGYYYECECEDTFSWNRFLIAAKYFHYYNQYKPLHCLNRLFVKYINISSKNRQSTSSLSKNVKKRINYQLKREFNLCKQFSNHNNGLVTLYIICCRKPNVFYIFMDRPDETLDDFLQKHQKNLLRNYSCSSKSFKPIRLISYEQTIMILKSITQILIKLHEKLIFHCRLTANSIFLKFRQQLKNQQQQQTMEIESIKLANLAFVQIFNNDNENQQQQQQQIEIQRINEQIQLYEIGIRLAECTKFESIRQRNRFNNNLSLLLSDDITCLLSSIDYNYNLNTNTNNNDINDNQSILHLFVQSL